MATITKRTNGWSVQVRRKGYSPRSRTLPTKAEALAWAREQEGLIDSRQAPTDLRTLRTTSLGDLMCRYLGDVTPKKRSAESEAARLSKMLRAPMANVALADLTPAIIAAYRDDRLLIAQPSTIRRELSLIRCIIDLAKREWGLSLPENPMDGVTRPAVSNERDRRLQRGELARLIEALKETRNPLIGPLVHFAIETAMRRGEVLALRWRDIAFHDRTAHIPITKTGKPRTIPLTDKALSILQKLPRTDECAFPLTVYSVKQAWRRLSIRAGLEDLHLHDLRHEALSRFAELGLTVPELCVISGHRDPRMLFRYTHLRPAELALKLAGREWRESA